MSREFLVWFEPVAEGLFGTAGFLLFVVSIGFLICCLALGWRDSTSTFDVKKAIRYTVICGALMVLLPLLMSALNPFTNGPMFYDEAHKAACQCKEKEDA